jgi:hypothetical protein
LFFRFVGAAKQFNDQRATAKNPLLQSEVI